MNVSQNIIYDEYVLSDVSGLRYINITRNKTLAYNL